jgi:predicted TIM-barrel fold metal-dependent hydrolase
MPQQKVALDRRRFIGGLAILGAAASLGWRGARAQTGAPRIIDTHHHIYPPRYTKANLKRMLADTSALPTSAYLEWTPQTALDQMDKGGVKTAIVSITSPGVWFGKDDEGRRWARECNEFGARMAQDHPGRFGMFAALPLPDTKGSLREIAYSQEMLKLDGIGLLTSYKGKLLGDKSFAPVFDEINRRKLIVFVHPTMSCCGNPIDGVANPVLEFPYDTGRTILSLLMSGTFVRCPDIRFIFSHGGGPVPMLNARVTGTPDRMPPEQKAKVAPNGALAELQKLYYDVASVANPISLGALTKMVPMTQITFGSDAPFGSIAATTKGLDGSGLTSEALAAIQHDNAARLFPRFA